MKQIPLTKGKFAIVDDEDYDYLNQWKWTFDKYAFRNPNNKKVWMHRLVNKTPNELSTDHINGDRLDNRKANLRSCTYAQNNKNAATRKDNKSGYRGVYWHGIMKKWCCGIHVDGKRIPVGYFSNLEDAATAYNLAAAMHHKEFAKYNKVAA